MNKAVFLDRDGVINEDKGYVFKCEEFSFLDGIFEICSAALEKEYLLFIVTNQAGIARGYYTEHDFRVLNRWMLDRFNEKGIHITAVYYCPYHPQYGVGIYRRDSDDRKPNPGMILKAQHKFDIELSKSILIGDKDSDIDAGRAAGIGKIIALQGKYSLTKYSDIAYHKALKDVIHIL